MGRHRIVVQAGPDAGRSIDVGTTPMTVGRGEGCGLRLHDGAVSRQHLTLCAVAGSDALELVEVTGANPVWTLRGGARTVLQAGDRLAAGERITLGNTTLEFALATAPAHTGGPTLAPAAPPNLGTVEMDARLFAAQAPSKMAALAALGDRLARCGSMQAVFRDATDWVVNALPATRVLLLSPDGTDVLGSASDGAVADLAMSPALLGRVLGESRGLLLPDVMAEPDLAERRSVVARGIVGAAAVPAANLILYAEWGPELAATNRYDDETLLLLICAAHLVSALAQSASERHQLRAASRVRHATPEAIPRMVGTSAALQKFQVFLERVAASPSTVLLIGESGTGKELAASSIHTQSSRGGGPFVAINCAAIPEGLLESELFGHQKGAFTGAVSQHDGVFQRADKGTLFLDEIGEMSLPTQARMLRVLETQRFTRVGGTKEVAVDVRVVAATHRDLRKMVEAGSFREDLFYRLSVIQTQLPALRERPEDVEPLALHFCDMLGGAMGRRVQAIAPDALAALQRYPWPGNVRELRNVVERALVLGTSNELELDDLPPEVTRAGPGPAAAPSPAGEQVPTLAEVERRTIAAALAATGGNKARAAAMLGIDRTTLYRKLKEQG